jgi:hypothetical protein
VPTDAKTFTADQERFIAWLALPKAQRVPKQQRDLAKAIGVDEGTLSDWKHLTGFFEAVNALARDLVKHDVADVLGVVRSRAKKGELAYVNMVLAMAGMAVDVEAAGKGPGQLKAYISVSPDDWSGST